MLHALVSLDARIDYSIAYNRTSNFVLHAANWIMEHTGYIGRPGSDLKQLSAPRLIQALTRIFIYAFRLSIYLLYNLYNRSESKILIPDS